MARRRHPPDGAARPRRQPGPPDRRGLLGVRVAAPRADVVLLAGAVLRPGRPRARWPRARHRRGQRGRADRARRHGPAVRRRGRRLGRDRGRRRLPMALRHRGPVGALEPHAHGRADGPAPGGRRRHHGGPSLGAAGHRGAGVVAGPGPPRDHRGGGRCLRARRPGPWWSGFGAAGWRPGAARCWPGWPSRRCCGRPRWPTRWRASRTWRPSGGTWRPASWARGGRRPRERAGVHPPPGGGRGGPGGLAAGGRRGRPLRRPRPAVLPGHRAGRHHDGRLPAAGAGQRGPRAHRAPAGPPLRAGPVRHRGGHRGPGVPVGGHGPGRPSHHVVAFVAGIGLVAWLAPALEAARRVADRRSARAGAGGRHLRRLSRPSRRPSRPSRPATPVAVPRRWRSPASPR